MAAKRKKDPASYRRRTYRRGLAPDGLVESVVRVRETDLLIFADRDVTDRARHLVLEYRAQIEEYAAGHGEFLSALAPLPVAPLAPPLVKKMLAAGCLAGVGPMAAVAGCLAEAVGRALLAEGAGEVIVENGGDIFLARRRATTLAIFAADSPLSNRIGIRIAADCGPVGVCTSSASVGHSLSFGRADAVTVVARDTAFADAVATATGNRVHSAADIEAALAWALDREGVLGVVIIVGDRLGAKGEVQLERL